MNIGIMDRETYNKQMCNLHKRRVFSLSAVTDQQHAIHLQRYQRKYKMRLQWNHSVTGTLWHRAATRGAEDAL